MLLLVAYIGLNWQPNLSHFALCSVTFVCSAIVIKDYANKAWPDIDLSLALVNKVKQFIDLYYQSVNLMFLLSNNKH